MAFGISRHYVLAAGGTGGHMVPAHALAEELIARGHRAALVTDDHQTYNAREMARSGGARMIAQTDFTPVELAKQMQKLGLEPKALANAAERAKSCGRPDAARELADLVERSGRDPAFVGAEDVAFRPVPAGGAYA